MSAISPEDFKSGRAISQEEWDALRRESLYGLPPELQQIPTSELLLPYQNRSIRQRLQNSVTFIEKSRRTGLTWAFAADAVLVSAADRSAGGMDTFYIGYNLEMAREFIDVCGLWAKLFAQAAIESGEFVFDDFDRVTGETRQVKAFRIRFASGYEIVALPSRPRSLRGQQGYVIVDEAAFHDDLAELLKAAMALLIWGGMVVVISTHDGEANEFNRYVKDIRAGLYNYGLVRIDFDDALRDGLYQRICQRKGEVWSTAKEAAWRGEIIGFYGEGADEELFCIPSEGSGAWLLPAVIEACMVAESPVLRWEMKSDFTGWPEEMRRSACQAWIDAVLAPAMARLDPELPSFFGMDFARYEDASVIWPGQMERNLKRTTPFTVEMRNIPLDQQEQILFWITDRLPRLMGGAIDAGGNGMAIAEHAAQKIGMHRVAQVQFSINWYREHMPKLKATLEANGMSLPKHVDVLSDFRLIKMIDGVARVPRQRVTQKGEGASDGKKRKRHGDSAIAAALFHFASLMPIVEYHYQPVGSSQGGLGHTNDDDDRDNHRSGFMPRLRGSL